MGRKTLARLAVAAGLAVGGAAWAEDAPPAPAVAAAQTVGCETLPIDLPTALRLVNAGNPTIALARERVTEAEYRLREAEVGWLPNLRAGPAYERHDGQLQATNGDVSTVSKGSLFTGGAALLNWDTTNIY